jgi:hypothetical protein
VWTQGSGFRIEAGFFSWGQTFSLFLIGVFLCSSLFMSIIFTPRAIEFPSFNWIAGIEIQPEKGVSTKANPKVSKKRIAHYPVLSKVKATGAQKTFRSLSSAQSLPRDRGGNRKSVFMDSLLFTLKMLVESYNSTQALSFHSAHPTKESELIHGAEEPPSIRETRENFEKNIIAGAAEDLTKTQSELNIPVVSEASLQYQLTAIKQILHEYSHAPESVSLVNNDYSMTTHKEAGWKVGNQIHPVATHAETKVDSQHNPVSLSSPPPFVEGFTPYAVGNVAVTTLTSESTLLESDHSNWAPGWKMAKIPGNSDYIPTLYWSNHLNLSIPLISGNLMRQMSFTGIVLQQGAGIVVGKIPSGVTIEFSDRADSPLFYEPIKDPQGNEVLALLKDTHAAKAEFVYFIVSNAAPGARHIFLSFPTSLHFQEPGDGAVAFPVKAGTVTYLDLTQPIRQTVTGRVLIASDEQTQLSRPVSGSFIRVIGQDSSVAFSNKDGYFELKHVLTFPQGYPFYLETEKSPGFTHRYSISPDKISDLSLFRVPARKIKQWINQIEGLDSPEESKMLEKAGIVFGALPSLALNYPSPKFYAHATSFNEPSLFKPETYLINDQGMLEPIENNIPNDNGMVHPVRNFLQKSSEYRFFSLVPEGPAIISVDDPEKGLSFSEYWPVSPGVINVEFY